MSSKQIYQTALTERRQQNRFRQLRSFAITGGAELVTDDNKILINFASNDYLGLTKNEKLKERAVEYVEKYGSGLGSSRLVSGNLSVYDRLEKKIADFKGTETAMLLQTGYQANVTVIAALGRKQTLLLSDHENHSSIATGLQLAQGRWQRFGHNDFAHLKARLANPARESTVPSVQHSVGSSVLNSVGTLAGTAVAGASAHADELAKWIISETVFSMDGDTTDVRALGDIATEFGASVYLDEAHATGVLGPEGRGLCFGSDNIDIVMGTFSKAMGSFGAYIACTKEMKDYLINFCSGLIYSTALPPAVLGAIDAALDLVPHLNSERAQLSELSNQLRTRLSKLGFSTGASSTHIIPVIVGEDADSLSLSRYLEECSIFAPAIRPPTVPDGHARIRLSLTCAHKPEHIDHLIDSISKWKLNG